MKKHLLILSLVSAWFISPLLAQDDARVPYSQTITQEDLRKHLTIIASDEFEGRDTGSKGQKLAAEYIRKHFESIGLAGPVKNGPTPYEQQFELAKKQWGEVYIAVGKKRLENLKDFVVYGDFAVDKQDVEFVFAGYGIDDPAYSDYTNLDVKGKAVIIIAGEPKKDDGTYLISGTDKPSRKSDNRAKSTLAREKGARMAVVVSDTDEAFARTLSVMKSYSGSASLGFPGANQASFGLVLTSSAGAVQMLKTSPKKYKKMVDNMVKTRQTAAGSMANTNQVRFESKQEPVLTENVLGFLEGTDKKDEILVITAHYDHVGIINGEIHNGADDDGSGTVTVMELAEAFAKAADDGKKPRRSILFMTVTGEEKGLLGSEYYSNNPVFPLDKTSANLNIDMVGRVDDKHKDNPNYIYIIGSDMLSSELHKLSEEVAGKYAPEVKLDYTYNSKDDPNRYYYRSDHYNFAKHNIPVIFYFNGTHQDYHKPGDKVEKIHFEKMEKVARLIFSTAWELANRDERPALDKGKQ